MFGREIEEGFQDLDTFIISKVYKRWIVLFSDKLWGACISIWQALSDFMLIGSPKFSVSLSTGRDIRLLAMFLVPASGQMLELATIVREECRYDRRRCLMTGVSKCGDNDDDGLPPTQPGACELTN